MPRIKNWKLTLRNAWQDEQLRHKPRPKVHENHDNTNCSEWLALLLKFKSRRALLRLARTVLNKPTGENEGEKNGKEKQKKGKRQKSPRAEKSRQQSW